MPDRQPLRRETGTEVVTIARCPEHGLHGERDTCFVCGGEVEQVELVPMTWRPWVSEREDEPSSPFSEFDAFGRKVPRRLGIADYLLVIARSEPARVRRVPQGAVAEDDEAEAFVECPCGARPIVGETLAKCPGCERNYVRFETGMVFVAYAGKVAPLRR